jgi:uracil-DNA glycosylase
MKGGRDQAQARNQARAIEVDSCTGWLRGELAQSRPRLVIPVGRLAIVQFMPARRLDEVIGARWPYRSPDGLEAHLIPLPDASGASTWFKMKPGKILLEQALALIGAHPARSEIRAASADPPIDVQRRIASP